MSLWFDFITTSVDNLCTWISVGNCVFVRPALWAGEKEHKSGSVSAVWVQPWMNSPRVARLLALPCHILKSSFVWEPPNIYPTPERALRRAGGSVSQTRDDNGSWGVRVMCWWALRQLSSATPMGLIHPWESHTLCLASSRNGRNENVTVMAMETNSWLPHLILLHLLFCSSPISRHRPGLRTVG